MVNDTTALEALFGRLPIDCEIIPIAAIRLGIIVRFKTFYLKVYDERGSGTYSVIGYTHQARPPLINFSIPYDKMHEFTSQLTEDNELSRPFNVTWLRPDSDSSLSVDSHDGY
jgi:hypothetical protein